AALRRGGRRRAGEVRAHGRGGGGRGLSCVVRRPRAPRPQTAPAARGQAGWPRAPALRPHHPPTDSEACATLRRVRWLIVLPFERPGLMGMDFAIELRELGHEVGTFAYRRDNTLYKNRGSKALYQRLILRRLERACVSFQPSI